MARITFKADAASESAGGGGGKQFAAAPRGIYTLAVADYSQGKKTTGGKFPGTPCTTLVCEIADDGEQFGKKVWHTVTWIPRGDGAKANGGHGMAVHFLHAVGMQFDGEFEFEEADFQGRRFRALLEVDTYDKVVNGKTYQNEKNVIAELYTDAHPEPGELPAPRAKAKPAVKQAVKVTGDEPVAELEDVPF